MIGPVREALSLTRRGVGPETAFDPQTSRRTFRLLAADPLEQIVMSNVFSNSRDNNTKL